MPAWWSLCAALDDVELDGNRVICTTRPDQWSADVSPAARRDAAEACTYCPARHACAAFASANGESGVWGGIDFTTHRPKKASTAA